MTDGKKMVWAATYAARLQYWQEKKRPKHMDAEQWEREMVLDAMEHAGTAVKYLRIYSAEFREGHGNDSESHVMLLEMRGLPYGYDGKGGLL
jgi:hypothetical protein